MPAIEFSRLRTKIELLSRVFDQPEQFVKDLSDLYFFYSDLTFQFNNSYEKTIAQPAYRTPVVINRELERALKPKAVQLPQKTLKIIDQLWATGTFEPCQLAAALLGALSSDQIESVLERIQNWSTQSTHPELVTMLHVKASETMRREKPELWLKTLSAWYASHDQIRRKQAILGLLPVIEDPEFKNLPIIFNFLEPIIANPDSRHTSTLLIILEKMRDKSESETVYFLKQVMINTASQNVPRLIRRALPVFSEEAQQSLKTSLRQNQS